MSDLQCPIPKRDYDRVLMAHGGGGRLMQQLLADVFFPAFANDLLGRRHDAAVLTPEGGAAGPRLAFTTDSYVIRPLCFPGGSIGHLAVYGTVNDLAMAGARPLVLSAAFILEEGFPIEELQRVVADMRDAAATAQVQIVTGDTKVVRRGQGDKVYINTAGVGRTVAKPRPGAIRRGDKIAQMVIACYERIEWEEGELNSTCRGAGGFGSSGR